MKHYSLSQIVGAWTPKRALSTEVCIDAKYEVDIIHKIRDGKCELSMKVPILPDLT